ncbi:MAG: TatD family hydrolase [Psychrobium sp.]|nr:TatD family hydrolase [Psychrobium sp.]
MSDYLIDIAVNLTASALSDKVEMIVNEAREAHVSSMITLGCDIASSQQALLLAQQYPGSIYATAGIHPHDAKSFDDNSLSVLKELLAQPEVVAVGECGLDFNRDFSPREQQIYAFEQQLELAATLNMPVLMHQRDAHDRFIEIFKRYQSDIPKAVLHCFTGTKEELQACVELDLYIGITGWICDERRGLHLLESVSLIPDNRLLLETDSPYLLPRDLQPKPKKRNNMPKYLPHIAKTVAQARGQSYQQLTRNCYKNSTEFFAI